MCKSTSILIGGNMERQMKSSFWLRTDIVKAIIENNKSFFPSKFKVWCQVELSLNPYIRQTLTMLEFAQAKDKHFHLSLDKGSISVLQRSVGMHRVNTVLIATHIPHNDTTVLFQRKLFIFCWKEPPAIHFILYPCYYFYFIF